MSIELTPEEEQLITQRRKDQEYRASLKQCPRCKGEGRVFSGYFGHPETSDGGSEMYSCSGCSGSGLVTLRQYRKLL